MSSLLTVGVLLYLLCFAIKMFTYDTITKEEWEELDVKGHVRLGWECLCAPYYLGKPLVQLWWRWWTKDPLDGSHDAL